MKSELLASVLTSNVGGMSWSSGMIRRALEAVARARTAVSKVGARMSLPVLEGFCGFFLQDLSGSCHHAGFIAHKLPAKKEDNFFLPSGQAQDVIVRCHGLAPVSPSAATASRQEVLGMEAV